jgi:uncharacterized damage-inducible protein DinB
MEMELIRGLYGYHRWANRRLFGVAEGLGAEAASSDTGKHWSFPTLKGMLAHIYGADRIWLARWKGTSPTRPLGPLLQHVVNHATHHRSEAATMITLISGSPPDTGIATYRVTVVTD